jgi:hypothetical protein
MNEQIFKRRKRIWQVIILFGLFAIYFGISTSENNFFPANIKYITGFLFILFGIWSYFTPYVIVNDSMILIKKDPISIYKIETDRIDDIEFLGDNVIIKYDKKKEKIKLKILEPKDQNTLVDILKALINDK